MRKFSKALVTFYPPSGRTSHMVYDEPALYMVVTEYVAAAYYFITKQIKMEVMELIRKELESIVELRKKVYSENCELSLSTLYVKELEASGDYSSLWIDLPSSSSDDTAICITLTYEV